MSFYIGVHEFENVFLLISQSFLQFGICCLAILNLWIMLQFSDGSSEVELKLQLGGQDVLSAKDVFVDADGTSLTVKVQQAGFIITLIDTNSLFEKIKPAETIWFVAVF